MRLIALATLASSLVESFEPSIHPLPSYVQLESVSQKYPVTLMQTLFSSVPKREYAISGINLTFGHVPPFYENQNNMDDGVVALTGRSASGKTTILRLIAGLESPVEGRVLINGQEIKVGNEQRKCPSWMMVGSTFAATSTKMVQPVIIASKPDFDNSQTVLQRMYQMGHDAVQFHSTTQNIGSQVDEKRDELLQKLALEFAHTLELTKEYQSCKPVDLSPSRQFLLAIACCCMVSVAPSVASLDPKNKQGVSIPYPILLFDELFDFEHSSTVAKCKEPILNLIQKGGVVVSVTHRQTYFMDMTSRSVTLSGGKVLSDLQMEMNIDLKDHRIYKS